MRKTDTRALSWVRVFAASRSLKVGLLMSHASWTGAVESIAATTGKASPELRALAKHLRIPVSQGTPPLVLAAQLRVALEPMLGLRIGYPPSEQQLEYLADLAGRVGVSISRLSDLDGELYEAWLQHCWLLIRRQALDSLMLESGDIVMVNDQHDVVECVSSIGDDGAVYFRGQRGVRAWPDALTLVARHSDRTASAEQWRAAAATRAALRARTDQWSAAKEVQLGEYKVPLDPTVEQLLHLEEVVASAADERPVQAYLEHNPQVLAALLRGPHRFVKPQVRVGTEYVADFFIADVDSTGVRWVLVELESPRSTVALRSVNDFEKRARKGISQIREWREWLQVNLPLARRPVVEHGLGLIDIRPAADGLVLVGTRAGLSDRAADLRRGLWEDARIQVRTYDWLVETVRSALAFNGPPGYNPHLLAREEPDNPLQPPSRRKL